jgi:hypothetical protein
MFVQELDEIVNIRSAEARFSDSLLQDALILKPAREKSPVAIAAVRAFAATGVFHLLRCGLHL